MKLKEIMMEIIRFLSPGVLISVAMLVITVSVGDRAVTFSDNMLWVIALSVQLGIFLVEISRYTPRKHLVLYDKAEAFDKMKVILNTFFSEKADESAITDIAQCYDTLGKLRDLTVDTSEKEK